MLSKKPAAMFFVSYYNDWKTTLKQSLGKIGLTTDPQWLYIVAQQWFYKIGATMLKQYWGKINEQWSNPVAI